MAAWAVDPKAGVVVEPNPVAGLAPKMLVPEVVVVVVWPKPNPVLDVGAPKAGFGPPKRFVPYD